MAEDVMFKTDFGLYGATLGYYDDISDRININLEGIFIQCMHDFYGCPRVPEEYESPDEFEDFLIRRIGEVSSHEHTHKALTKIEGSKVSRAYDNVSLIEANVSFETILKLFEYHKSEMRGSAARKNAHRSHDSEDLGSNPGPASNTTYIPNHVCSKKPRG